MDVPDTVTDAVRLLEADGYIGDLSLDRTVHCDACGRDYPPSRLVIRRTYRFEGDTDPADEAIVLGVECPECGVRGVIVSAYGPDADPQLLALVERLGG